MKKINFKQGKYWLPLVVYAGLLFIGYEVIDIFNLDIKKSDDNLQTTEYLNSELPNANLRADLGSKTENVSKKFGKIKDYSAIEGVGNDTDSLKKTEEYESHYTDEEVRALEQQEKDRAELERLRELEKRLSSPQKSEMSMDDDDFLASLSSSERNSLSRFRRHRSVIDEETEDVSDMPQDTIKNAGTVENNPQAVKALDENAESSLVVKKLQEKSDYFNTLSDNQPESSLIKAIIDEDIKATDGSRVRLRLLDDIEIGEVQLKKGNYLYCTMSGFGSQRVKGKIQSVLVGDDLYKINLSVYDTDGLEGLYVPSSSFRETTKDVAGSAMQGNMNVTSGMSSGTNVTQFANQALQNAYQRASNAISKAIRKNRVHLKYGTQVYLVNGNQRKSGNR